ncbi:hypothetical protein F5884DRAFT_686772 [Xylogone sp. PMI_703]|nr:hypothetical protein F5884DRAFT_686772 [Xylogone sp. PMI_703]
MTHHITDDIERQVVLENNREAGSTPCPQQSDGPFQINIKLKWTDINPDKRLSKRAGQCCFLCLKKGKGQYAFRVPCIRPTKPRVVKRRRPQKAHKDDELFKFAPGGEIYGDINPKEKACESDTAIYDRLVKTCFDFHGQWKRWLPFYGITHVKEVKFRFIGVVERDGRFPIFNVTSVNLDEALEEADRTISLQPSRIDVEYGDVCSDEIHSSECQQMIDLGMPCINKQVEAARQRKRKLGMHYLLRDCARDPWSANGLRTLEGMAQRSCISDVE